MMFLIGLLCSVYEHLEDDPIKFWCGVFLPNCCELEETFFDMESIGMKLICDLIVNMLSELSRLYT